MRSQPARAYLSGCGTEDRAVIERLGIGNAPGARLRGYPEWLGYRRQALRDCGLVDSCGIE